MKKIILIALFVVFIFSSCDDSSVNVGDNSDIKKPLPEKVSLIIFRDALSFEYKFRMESDEKYPEEYKYTISNATLVDGENITIEMNELRGYENENWDGVSESIADAVINLGALYREEYNLKITQENIGEFNAKMKITDSGISFDIIEQQPFVYLKYDETKFLPENHFWGFIVYDKNSEYDHQKYLDDLKNAGAKETILEEGFYSYFNINKEGDFEEQAVENSNSITYNYYFAYDEANLDAIKSITNNYADSSINILNITFDGNFFPGEE